MEYGSEGGRTVLRAREWSFLGKRGRELINKQAVGKEKGTWENGALAIFGE